MAYKQVPKNVTTHAWHVSGCLFFGNYPIHCNIVKYLFPWLPSESFWYAFPRFVSFRNIQLVSNHVSNLICLPLFLLEHNIDFANEVYHHLFKSLCEWYHHWNQYSCKYLDIDCPVGPDRECCFWLPVTNDLPRVLLFSDAHTDHPQFPLLPLLAFVPFSIVFAFLWLLYPLL